MPWHNAIAFRIWSEDKPREVNASQKVTMTALATNTTAVHQVEN